MPDEGMGRRLRQGQIMIVHSPTIPVDPAGDYLYQGSTNPCERIGLDPTRTAQ